MRPSHGARGQGDYGGDGQQRAFLHERIHDPQGKEYAPVHVDGAFTKERNP